MPPARYVRFSEARPILTELKAGTTEAAWPAWIARRDRDIRARLEQGDEDTIVNWILFGTSFTTRPRAVLGAVEAGTGGDQELVLRRTIELISARLDDLIAALTAPGSDERRLFARALLQRKGLRFATAADLEAVRKYLMAAVIRVASEQDHIDQELGATSGGDPAAEFARRSRLFRTRGLSLDTSLMANHSVEQALSAMKARGVLTPGGVKRVGIIGPGLDFADKDVGFDVYPQQTVQPFAVLDSLDRLGLAASSGTDVVLLDISPRIIDHVTQARARAAKNVGYTLNLPLPKTTPWVPAARAYWKAFGDRVGAAAPATPSKAAAELADWRTVRVRPSIVQRVSIVNLNAVTERIDGAAFDLVVATNVFVYYDELEQALAMANVAAMLEPGGFLLANITAPRLASAALRPVDTTRTPIAAGRESIVDFLVWYRVRAD